MSLIFNGKYGSNVQAESLLYMQDKTLSDISEINHENETYLFDIEPHFLLETGRGTLNGVASRLFWEFFPREMKDIIFPHDEIEPT